MRATLKSSPAKGVLAAATRRPVQRRGGSNDIHQQAESRADQRAADMSSTPRLVAQRRQLQATFGNAIQCKTGPEDEELLQGRFPLTQRKAAPEEEELQMKAAFPTAQRRGPEEEDLMQGKFSTAAAVAQLEAGPYHESNQTGIPDSLKSGIEALSGVDVSNVRVHRNSAKPSQLSALAYAQGNHIHLGPGQEEHLPHEAWHVVQQAQGRVKPTMQLKDGVPVNDDKRLEHEADVMGGRALDVGQRTMAGRPSQIKGGPARVRTSDIGVRRPLTASIPTRQMVSGHIVQRRQTDVCLKSASGTYTVNNVATPFNFTQTGKGSDVLYTSKSHPAGHVDETDRTIKYLKKIGVIPKDATVVLTAHETYGMKK